MFVIVVLLMCACYTFFNLWLSIYLYLYICNEFYIENRVELFFNYILLILVIWLVGWLVYLNYFKVNNYWYVNTTHLCYFCYCFVLVSWDSVLIFILMHFKRWLDRFLVLHFDLFLVFCIVAILYIAMYFWDKIVYWYQLFTTLNKV